MTSQSLARFSIVALLVAVVPSLAVADMEAGFEAIKNKDFEKARREFEPVAAEGDSSAQYNLALLHQRGDGGPMSGKLALQWFQAAANQGVADAAYALGLIYANGEGTNPDLEESYMWLRIAEIRGNKGARKSMRELKQVLTLKQVIEARKAADLKLADD